MEEILRTFKVIGKQFELVLRAESKGDAKRIFMMRHPEDQYLEIIDVSKLIEEIVEKSLTEHADIWKKLADI